MNTGQKTIGGLLIVVVAVWLLAGSQASTSRWEYARWVESPGVSVWESAELEHFGTSPYATYQALGGKLDKTVWAKPGERIAMMNQAGAGAWQLCGIEVEGSTVYFFKRRARK